MNNFWVKKYKTRIGKIAIKQAAINRLKFGPTSLTKLYIETVTGYQSSLVKINKGHAKLFHAIIKVNRDTVTMIGLLIGNTTLIIKIKWEDPSILAASHNSFGIFLKYCLSKKITKILPIKGTVKPCNVFIQDGPNGNGIISPRIINKWGSKVIISGIINDNNKV